MFKAVPSPLILMALTLLAIILALWMPFGLTGGDIREHWHIRALIDIGTSEYPNLPENELIELAITRPIARLLYWSAYFFSPGNFLGDNLLAILIIWGKSLALMGIILRLFPKRYLLAFIIAALLIIYPADTANSSLRIPHIQFAIFAYLLASYFMLSYWQLNQRKYLVAMVFSLIIACLSYEVLHPAVFLTPLIILLLEKKFSQRFFKLALFWYLPAILVLAYSLYLIFGLNFGFQAEATRDSLTTDYIMEQFGRVYNNVFVLAWDANSQRLSESWFAYGLGIGLFVSLASALVFYFNREHERLLNRREFSAFFAVSLLLVLLGYIMYIPTNRSNPNLDYRIFLLSSVGGTAFLGGLAYQLALLIPRKLGLPLLLVLVGAASSFAAWVHLSQHLFYQSIFEEEKAFFQPLLSIIPDTNQAVTLIFLPADGIERQGRMRSLLDTHPHILTSALQYIYGAPSRINFAMVCPDIRLCTLSAEGINITFERAGEITGYASYPVESLILIELSPDGSMRLLSSYPDIPDYHPENLINVSAPLPPRLSSIFGD